MAAVAEQARAMLLSLGYGMQDGDEAFLELCAGRAEAEVKNFCNLSVLPEELVQSTADLALAEFLEAKRCMGRLDGFEHFDYGAAVRQLQEGDTTVSYAEGSTAESRLTDLIRGLRLCRGGLAAWRRLKW